MPTSTGTLLTNLRYYSILGQIWSMLFQFGVLKIVQLPTAIGLILCIVGATSAPTPALIDDQATVHAGIILFAIVWVMLTVLTIIAGCCRKKIPDQERLLLKAIGFALPFILIHIIYSLCATFSHDAKFNVVTGSPTIYLCMSVLEEMAITCIYVYAGLRLKTTPLPADASSARELGYRAGRGDFGTGRLGLLTLGIGVFNAFRSRPKDEEMAADIDKSSPARSQERQHSRSHSYRHHQSSWQATNGAGRSARREYQRPRK